MKKSWVIAGIVYFMFASVTFGTSIETIGSLPGDLVGDVQNAQFLFPYGIFVDGNGVLWLVDQYNHKIKKCVDGEVYTVLGNSTLNDFYGFPLGFYQDGPLDKVYFNRPESIWVEEDQIYIVDTENHVIRLFKNDKMYTLAGNGKAGYTNGANSESSFHSPSAMVKDGEGNIFVADTLNHVIRKINPQGQVSTYAGIQSEEGGYQDGSLLNAQFNEPSALSFSPEGNLLILDSGNHLIRIINGEKVSTYTGATLSQRISGCSYLAPGYVDGHHECARFNFPKGMMVLGDGRILVADSGNKVIRMVHADRSVSTIETPSLDKPVGVWLHKEKLYISDTFAHQVIVLDVKKIEDLNFYKETSPTIDISYKGNLFEHLDIKPLIKNNQSYIPIRSAIEAMGGHIEWIGKSQEIFIYLNEKTWLFSIQEEGFDIYENRIIIRLEDWNQYFGLLFE